MYYDLESKRSQGCEHVQGAKGIEKKTALIGKINPRAFGLPYAGIARKKPDTVTTRGIKKR
jgi:hypothetical protein